MGVSTNAVLCFGIDLGESLPERFCNEDGDEEFEDFIERRAGIKRPDREYQSGDFETDPEWRAYFDARREAIISSPADLVVYCSGEYPMYILAVRNTELQVHRGDVMEIAPDMFTIPPAGEIEAFRQFCKAVGVGGEPRWLLASYWG